MYFLGIDGGGTKTEFIVIDENGYILGHALEPTCHYKQTSFKNFKEVIQTGIEKVCNQSKIIISQIDYAFIGIPGYGEIEKDKKVLDSIIEDILSSRHYSCVNDSVVAWAGSLACQPGINIVAGTGAIGFGMDSERNFARASGWGHFCGDEGSAYWLGQKMIELFTKQADGRIIRTPLYEIVKKELGIKNDFEFLDYVINDLKMERNKIAQLAKLLYKAAKLNDEIALKVYSEAAYEHYLTIAAIVKKLNFDANEEIMISYSGGVFNAGEYVLGPLRRYLIDNKLNIKLITPILKPITGAALCALIIYLNEVNDSIIERLKEEEKNKL